MTGWDDRWLAAANWLRHLRTASPLPTHMIGIPWTLVVVMVLAGLAYNFYDRHCRDKKERRQLEITREKDQRKLEIAQEALSKADAADAPTIAAYVLGAGTPMTSAEPAQQDPPKEKASFFRIRRRRRQRP